jgi:hypothetical protein
MDLLHITLTSKRSQTEKEIRIGWGMISRKEEWFNVESKAK